MNITIILPAVHVTSNNNSKRQRGNESPQPTTPFPPISITPSPTPFSEGSTYNQDDYKDLIDEYNRELAENHMSKSRAEIVARQAAYDDVEVAKSDSGGGTNTGSGTTSPVVATGGGGSQQPIRSRGGLPGGSSAPCPYCSSSESLKSETSFRSLGKIVSPVGKTSVIVNTMKSYQKNGGSGGKRGRKGSISTTHASPSTDLTTESPSSVDTVNTVIQSKAYDILGELNESENAKGKEKRDKFEIASTLDDSFESIDSGGQEEISNLILNEEEEYKTEIFINETTPPVKSPTPPAAIRRGSVGSEKIKTPSPSTTPSPNGMIQGDRDYAMTSEERNLEFLYEEEEEEEEEPEVEKSLKTFTAGDEDLGENLKDTEILTLDEKAVITEEKEEEKKMTEKIESREQSVSPSPLPSQKISFEEKEMEKPAPLENIVQFEFELPQESSQLGESDSNTEKLISTDTTPVTPPEKESQIDINEDTQQNKENTPSSPVLQEEVEQVPKSEEKLERQASSEVNDLEKVDNDEKEMIPINEESKVESDTEKKVPVTETGNEEVTIIVTQDDMPAANIFER